jgi:L-ascorbate metabolism protein UlaG (beta-lactamase superfamily)
MKPLGYLVILSILKLNAMAIVTEHDIIPTSQGDLTIHFIGHGTLMFEFKGKTIHVDPYSNLFSYTRLPKADLVLVTHHHGDHLDSTALADICTEATTIYWTELCQANSKYRHPATSVQIGSKLDFQGITIEVVPAYNIANKRPNGQPYHPRGEGVGYILTFGDKRVYVAGDTENIPEMKNFGRIDIAFLPMNLPYTMTPEMVREAALVLKPKILYPYHFGKTDTGIIVNLLKDNPEVEVRVKKME